jgi:hypothetical protein
VKSFLKITKNENENFHPLFTVPILGDVKNPTDKLFFQLFIQI